MSSLTPIPPLDAEWLEADGLGGYASGTVGGLRTRRYHALLLTATTPPTGRMVLVNGFDAWLETAEGNFPLIAQRYAPDVIAPSHAAEVAGFSVQPWPCWTLKCANGCELRQEIIVSHGSSAVFVGWTLLNAPAISVKLHVRPFFSGRDFHSMHHENGAFRFAPEQNGTHWIWRPYDGVPAVTVKASGDYHHEPLWYRQFLYTEERARGLDDAEDLAAPGVFTFDLTQGFTAELAFAAEGHEAALTDDFAAVREREQSRRAAFAQPLHQSADAYLVKRDAGRTIIAGYPWFGDWGRDTFISMRGLCLATGRLDEARDILLQWASAVSKGMLPNCFLDGRSAPEYNSVDASLWYVIAVQDYLQLAAPDAAVRDTLQRAVESILQGYSRGTRHGIRMDADGLLACGEPGVQLTWMDAKVGDWVVTPRVGKPVEVQALWLNALAFGATFSETWAAFCDQGVTSFDERFWNASTGALFDVLDVDHQRGVNDASLRPNQIFAVGGLPLVLMEGERARRIVDVVEEHLLTPLGLRTLAPGSVGYAGHYEGGVLQRDGSYHQGTAWPWLTCAFVEAWLRVHGDTVETRAEARTRFMAPLQAHLQVAGLGHVSEIADADAPYTPRGCPFQAWSLGELIRLEALLK